MTQPLSPAQVASSIARAIVTYLDTGTIVELESRPNSRCLFFDRFAAGPYVIQLRLDWGDIDVNGNPLLDADFIDPATGRVDHSMRAHAAHHTSSTNTAGARTYEWLFSDVGLRFTVAISWSVSATCSATSSASLAVEVIRAQPEGEREHG